MTRTVLKMDIDFLPEESWMKLYKETRVMMLESLGFKLVEIIEHKSSYKGIHIFMHIEGRELSSKEINMLQWIVGNDDHTRCKINAWRIERGILHWNKIFDRKLFRKKAKTITCFYCGNIIPLIGVDKK